MTKINDTMFSLDDTQLAQVTGGGKIGRVWKAVKKAGEEVVDGAKKAWDATPTSVKVGLLTNGVAGGVGAGAAYLQHKFD